MASRLAPSADPLVHPRRRLIHAYVVQNPGPSFREVVRACGIPSGTARHHLSVLKRHRLLVERRHGCTTRFFENHGRFDKTWGDVVLLREASLAELQGWLEIHGESNQSAILAAMPWSRSTTQHRLARLLDGGLVDLR